MLGTTFSIMVTIGINDLSTFEGGKASAGDWACNLGLGTAGLIWSTAAGMATAGAGFVVGLGWVAFQTWLCGMASE